MVIRKMRDLDRFKRIYVKHIAHVSDLFFKATLYNEYYIKYRENKDDLVNTWYYDILNNESIKRFNKSFFEIVPELEDLFYNMNVAHSVLYEGLTEKGLKRRIKKEKKLWEKGW